MIDVKNYKGQNPFSDSQARNFSDKKVTNEFYPISLFWSLFNDQHEILLGSRGSGKTFLLKMMRYSMLKKIQDQQARKLVSEKKFLALYVPLHLEFVVPFNNDALNEERQINLFQVCFNCFLAESMLIELKSIIEDYEDLKEKVEKQVELVSYLEEIWLGRRTNICDFETLSSEIEKVYYSIDWTNSDEGKIPVVFKRQICTPLIATKKRIKEILNLNEDPTWIVCIDEAEFLNNTLQKCINSVFRSDSNRIALKVATLPFYHRTLSTLEEGVSISDGNDFCYRVVDMLYESQDFINLTNKLCSHRLTERIGEHIVCESLEDFVGVVGKDDLIDYYRFEVGEERAEQAVVEQAIIDDFPPKRKKAAPGYTNKRKTVFDKYAPIFYLREMYKLSNTGNHKPGWYAGAKVIRKVSQGNPRLYIQLMGYLFEKARETTLTPKAQHEVIYNFSLNMCSATKALELEGPLAFNNMQRIADCLKEKTHGEYLVTSGYTFSIQFKNDEEFEKNKRWIELAIAYSRIIVDEEVKKAGITRDTIYVLSNVYAVAYWIPMRNDVPVNISMDENIGNTYKVSPRRKVKRDAEFQQLSLFEEE